MIPSLQISIVDIRIDCNSYGCSTSRVFSFHMIEEPTEKPEHQFRADIQTGRSRFGLFVCTKDDNRHQEYLTERVDRRITIFEKDFGRR